MEEAIPGNPRLSAERRLLYTILDSELVLEDKLHQLAEAMDRDGADIGCTLPDVPALAGVFPLLLAVNVGDAELVEFIVGRGADVSQTMDEPYFEQAVCPTALHQACLDGRLDLVRVLAETDDSTSSITFSSSAAASSSSSSTSCCHSPKPLSSSQPRRSSAFSLCLEQTNARGQTPYHLAVESGNADLVGYLVERGSWIDACDANGNNALHMTTCLSPDRQALDMVDTLLTLGVSIYHRNRLGFTPVKQAMLLGREASARLMLSRNCVGKGLQEVGFHPLEAAVVNRRRRVISAILDRLQTNSGCSPVAATKVPETDESLNIVVLNSGLNGILEQLLTCAQMRAHIDVNGSIGYTPLYNACASHNTIAVRLLLEAGADPDRPSLRQHVLPLKKTVLQNDLETSRLLLDFGASACHCFDCSPLLRSSGVSSGGSQALVGMRDGELDLLYLALFTDVSLCRLLIAGGTCVSYKSLEVLCRGSHDHRDLLMDLYIGGHHDVLRRILDTEPEEQDVELAVRNELREVLRSPPPLKLICRSRFRAMVKPRVYWAIRKIVLPQSIVQYLLLEI